MNVPVITLTATLLEARVRRHPVFGARGVIGESSGAGTILFDVGGEQVEVGVPADVARALGRRDMPLLWTINISPASVG